MTRVIFTFNDGRTRNVSQAEARLLVRMRRGTLGASDAEADGAPPADSVGTEGPTSAAPETPAPRAAGQASTDAAPAAVDIATMDADALRALAKDRGVKVHYNAGADKIREALRQAKA